MKITDNNSIQGAKASGIQPFRTVGQDGGGMAEMAEKPSLDVEHVLGRMGGLAPLRPQKTQ